MQRLFWRSPLPMVGVPLPVACISRRPYLRCGHRLFQGVKRQSGITLEKKPQCTSVMLRQCAARRCAMAKGQMKSNKETHRPKKDKAKPARLGPECQSHSPSNHLPHWSSRWSVGWLLPVRAGWSLRGLADWWARLHRHRRSHLRWLDLEGHSRWLRSIRACGVVRTEHSRAGIQSNRSIVPGDGPQRGNYRRDGTVRHPVRQPAALARPFIRGLK